MISWRIQLFFFQKFNSKVETTISYLPISVIKFICIYIVGHWDHKLHNICHMTTKINNKKGQKQKTLPISARERCRSPSNHMLWKQKISSVSIVVMLFSVRLINFVTIYKRNKNNSKKGNYAQKSENFVWKLVVPKARKPCVKTIGHKISLYSIDSNSWHVLPENKQNVD